MLKTEAKTLNLKRYDLVLTYSWSDHQRYCTGHIFECIEYYHILSKKYNCCIMIGDCLDFENVLETVLLKYTFTDEEKQNIRDNIIIADNPRIVMGNKILLVDGNWPRLKNKVLSFKEKFCFPCGCRCFKNFPDDVKILGDSRIYINTTTHYVKKVLLDKFVSIPDIEPTHDIMLYLTKGPRYLSNEQIENVLKKYPNKKVVIYTDYDIMNIKFDCELTILKVPVNDMWDFKEYVYTDIQRQFDCSPRFIVECQHFGKKVNFELTYNIMSDLGLYNRSQDMKNIETVTLTENDDILELI